PERTLRPRRRPLLRAPRGAGVGGAGPSLGEGAARAEEGRPGALAPPRRGDERAPAVPAPPDRRAVPPPAGRRAAFRRATGAQRQPSSACARRGRRRWAVPGGLR